MLTIFEYAEIETLILIVASLVAFWILYRLQKRDDQFDLKHLLVDSNTNRVSLQKTGQLVALLFSSWAFVYETRSGRLTEWLFIGYMVAWSGANLASKYIDSKATPVQIQEEQK